MPSQIHQAIARQWQLLKLLPSRSPGKSARELAEALGQEGFEVTKRTVERDLNMLMTLFPIRCNDKGIPYGWHWVEDAQFDLPSLTVTDALSLRLLEDFLKPIVPASMLKGLTARFQLAANKLKTLYDLPKARWAEKVRVVLPSLHLLPPQVDPVVQDDVQEALLCDEQIEVLYHSPTREEPTSLILHPLGLVQRGPVTYLVATAFEYDDIVTGNVKMYQKWQ
ncbi:helix-turn-helix transcriptional regulator [Thiovibrio sp. JS02]